MGSFAADNIDIVNAMAPSSALGSVYLPASGTPVGRFDFLVDRDSGGPVEIGTLVSADTDEGRCIGVVVDMRTVGTDSDPVAADLSRHPGGRVGFLPAVRCATVQVLASPSMRPVGAGDVHAATHDDVLRATRTDEMEWPIPIGVVRLTDGSAAPIHVDGAFVLGPEAQGFMVFGRSGIAAKTSFMTVALRSALAAGDEQQHRTAAVVFNVKGHDLVSLDLPPADDKALTADDLAMYEAMGVSPTPFDDVAVYAVPVVEGAAVASPRADSLPLAWDLRAVWPYLSVFFDTANDPLMADFLPQFEDRYLRHPSASQRIDSFEKLDRWLQDEIEAADEAGSPTIFDGRVHVTTARRLRRKFSGLRSRSRGLFTAGTVADRAASDIPDSGWMHGQVRTVDLAGLTSDVQGFVIARTVDRLLRAAERGELGVDHLVILTDELNAWAPASGGREVSRVRQSLQRVATQGRYAGISLIAAAQSGSKIDDLLRDQASTFAVGSSSESELTSGVVGRLPGGLIERIATLPKGQMLVQHVAFRQGLVIQFPRPAWRMGRNKTTAGAKPTASSLLREHVGSSAFERVSRQFDGDQIDQIAADAGTLDAAADILLDASRSAADRLHAPRDVDPANPFNLD